MNRHYIEVGGRMKKLIIVNGTMGVGKTTICNELLKCIPNSVFLDGDWCWNMNPFVVTDETKSMVMNNITHLLRNFLNCSIYDTVIFCWVIHQNEILNEILDSLQGLSFTPHVFTLDITREALIKRLQMDVENGIRTGDVIERSLQRLELYQTMHTIKIDVSEISAKQAAEEIIELYHSKG